MTWLGLLLSGCLQPSTAVDPDPVTPSTPVVTPTPTPPPVTPEPETPVPPTEVPPVTADRMSVLGHAQECAQALGPIPGFDCIEDADPVPVLVDGVQATSNPSTCDTPSLLEGSCNIWTRAGSKPGTNHDGSLKPEVTFAFTCRSSDDQAPTDEGGVYHDVAMIGHNADTGATCYFQSFPDGRVRYFPSPNTAESTPDYGTMPAEDRWDEPASTANINCQRCHSADPWIHSPWIDQVESRHDAPSPIVPWTGSNDSPYHIVGTAFLDWEMSYFDLPDNACTSCHRIGTRGCNTFVDYSAGDNSFMPLSTTTQGVPWMPPAFPGDDATWEGIWRDPVEEILDCCANPSNPSCNRTPTPEGTRYIDPLAPTSIPLIDTGITPLPCGLPDADIASAVGPAVYTVGTCGEIHDYPNTCGGGSAEDVAITWTAPAAGQYTLDTYGSDYDTALVIRETCADGDAELACDDDSGGGQQSELTHTFALNEEVVIVLDGYTNRCGQALLNITAPPVP
jgi:hypothetical protein